jgi:hypothetical protein
MRKERASVGMARRDLVQKKGRSVKWPDPAIIKW